jgi:hypothetical protein
MENLQEVIRKLKAQEPYDVCPKCGSARIFGANANFSDGEAWRTFTCRDCNFQWNEVYMFTHNEDSQTCELLNRHGAVIHDNN